MGMILSPQPFSVFRMIQLLFSSYGRRSGILLILTVLAWPRSASGQDRFTNVETISAADSLFSLGVTRFSEENFVDARIAFSSAVNDFPLHRNTTAAALMSAKSAFRMHDFETAEKELDEFLQRYPSSSYRTEARFSFRLAREAADRIVGETLDIGVVLSLHEDEVTQSQALFNGVRLAVERVNQSGIGTPVRMIFRDTNSSPRQAAEAVRELADLDVAFVLGTLFSDQAIAAAEAAEREKVVFMAPLATDERVSSGKQYSFQANVSIGNRGRLMARFAVLGLQLDSLGVVTRTDEEGISERLSDAFIQEASSLGARINLVSILTDENAWVTLSETLTADTLKYVEAVYMPVTDLDPQSAAGAILSSFDRMGANTRILGNSAWHNLPMVSAASRYTTTYSNDYYLQKEDPLTIRFDSLYALVSDSPPDRLAYTGYDVANFLLNILARGERLALDEAIRQEPIYRGLATRIDFRGSNVNGALFFHRYRDDILALIR